MIRLAAQVGHLSTTTMWNEIVFLAQVAVSLAFVLIACRLGYGFVVGLISAQVVLMNIFVLKQLNLFGLAVTGGNVLYASIFLATDIISEHYGKDKAHRAVWVGFYVSVFFVLSSQFILLYLPNAFDFAHSHLASLLKFTPRIVVASMIAYLVSQHLDVRLYEWYGFLTGGKHLWLRNNLSTWTSQLVDSILFTTLALWGVMPNLLEILLFTYIVKLTVAVLDTPFIYLSCHPWFRPPGSLRRDWRRKTGQSYPQKLQCRARCPIPPAMTRAKHRYCLLILTLLVANRQAAFSDKATLRIQQARLLLYQTYNFPIANQVGTPGFPDRIEGDVRVTGDQGGRYGEALFMANEDAAVYYRAEKNFPPTLGYMEGSLSLWLSFSANANLSAGRPRFSR